MEMHDHGGYCCGMRHIQGFMIWHVDGYFTEDRVNKNNNMNLTSLDDLLDAQSGWVGEGILCEIVLTQTQNFVWSNVLLNRGFKLVNSFCNSNTGNNIYIYHKAPPVSKDETNPYHYKQIEELSDNPKVVGAWQGGRPSYEEEEEVGPQPEVEPPLAAALNFPLPVGLTYVGVRDNEGLREVPTIELRPFGFNDG